MCILYVYTMQKVVGYYDLSVLSMSVMGFQKKSLDGEVDGWGELYPRFFLIFGIFFTLQSPLASWCFPFVKCFVCCEASDSISNTSE